MDTSGVALVRALRERCEERGEELRFAMSPQTSISSSNSPGSIPPHARSLNIAPPRVGIRSRRKFPGQDARALRHLVRFIGDLTLAGLRVARQPRKLRNRVKSFTIYSSSAQRPSPWWEPSVP